MSSALVSRLEQLRELIRHTERPAVRGRLVAEGISEGLPQGILIELIGTAKAEWMMRLLALNPDVRLAWLEHRMTVFPTAMSQRGVSLNRAVFIETEKNLLWSARQVLQSQLFGCVVLPGIPLVDRELKRLQLGCEKSGCSVFFMAERPSTNWPISVRLQIDWKPGPKPEWALTLLRSKGG